MSSSCTFGSLVLSIVLLSQVANTDPLPVSAVPGAFRFVAAIGLPHVLCIPAKFLGLPASSPSEKASPARSRGVGINLGKVSSGV